MLTSHWEAEVWVKAVDPTTKVPKVESKHITHVSQEMAELSMEDVAYNAFVYYHGLRLDRT
jgi:hypothetical protein